MALFDYLKSTLISKVVMAVTGVIIVLFLLVHAVGNTLVYFGPEAFNAYAAFLQGLGELLWLFRIVLFLCLVLHVITSIRLKYLNWTAKPDKYKMRSYIKATLTGRTMIWTGIMIFAFLVYHLLHFTIGVVDAENFSKNNPEYYEKETVVVEEDDAWEDCKKEILKGETTAEECEEIHKKKAGSFVAYEGDKYKPDNDKVLFKRPNAYYMVVMGFNNVWISLLYIVGVILLGFHLSHAIQSMFQTLGLNHPKYNGFFRKVGPVLSTLLVLCFISIPITIYTGLVGGGV